MHDYIREFAAVLEDASANDGISLGPTDAAVCAAALRLLASATEATEATRATIVGLLAAASTLPVAAA